MLKLSIQDGGLMPATTNTNCLRTGRDGLLRLGFERSGNATVLSRCRYMLPLQVLSPLALDDGSSYLLLLNPTGGVLGGDHLRTEISLGENAHACISTPSATRVYRTKAAPAEMHAIIHIGRGATIEYFPDHVIPHPGSSLRQSLRVEMDEGSRGILFDGFCCGRIAMNERWQFRDFDSRMEVFLRDQPIFANRTEIAGDDPSRRENQSFGTATRPPSQPLPAQAIDARSDEAAHEKNLSAMGRMGGYSYCGSLAIIADGFEKWRGLVDALRVSLDATAGIFGGASLLTHSGCSARYLAHSAIEFHAATQNLWAIARQHVLNLPAFKLRKY